MQGIDSLRESALPTARRRRPWGRWIEFAWAGLWILGLGAILLFQHWEAVPFHLIWITFALLYGFGMRSAGRSLCVLVAMCGTTFAAIGWDVVRGTQPAAELTEVPLMAAMFWVMMWHGRRSHVAGAELIRVSEENERLLAIQRRFLQDASHQLKTPITIALGHSELLARNLADHQGQRDINVIVGELTRLRTLSERLLLIAASANPDFLRPEPVELDHFMADLLLRWRPTADRRWQLGTLDPATAAADAERLSLAVDALLENAIQHTVPDDLIRLSVVAEPDGASRCASLVVQDTGSGIAADEFAHIFERFSTGSRPVAGRRGTGLGLSLVRAVAEGHGGEVRATSVPGLGSRFEIIIPVGAAQPPALSARSASAPEREDLLMAAPVAAPAAAAAATRPDEYRSGR